MNILVFGGNGFLGKEIEKQLRNSDLVFFSASRNAGSGYIIDISNFDSFTVLPMNFFDIVINCATILPGGNYLDNDYLERIYQTNILGTQNICKWIATQKSIKKIINCSSLAVVNKPWDVDLNEKALTYPKGDHVLYCSSKLMQELIIDTFAAKHNLAFYNVRFSAIYGEDMPKNGIIWTLHQQIVKNNIIKIHNGNIVSFDFINVIDAANILISIIDSNVENGIINAASGVETTLYELSTILRNATAKSVVIENVDHENVHPNRAVINISKLQPFINTEEFISLEKGINQILLQW